MQQRRGRAHSAEIRRRHVRRLGLLPAERRRKLQLRQGFEPRRIATQRPGEGSPGPTLHGRCSGPAAEAHKGASRCAGQVTDGYPQVSDIAQGRALGDWARPSRARLSWIFYSLEDIVEAVQALEPGDFVKSEAADSPPKRRRATTRVAPTQYGAAGLQSAVGRSLAVPQVRGRNADRCRARSFCKVVPAIDGERSGNQQAHF
jgi:hypothetical protein